MPCSIMSMLLSASMRMVCWPKCTKLYCGLGWSFSEAWDGEKAVAMVVIFLRTDQQSFLFWMILWKWVQFCGMIQFCDNFFSLWETDKCVWAFIEHQSSSVMMWQIGSISAFVLLGVFVCLGVFLFFNGETDVSVGTSEMMIHLLMLICRLVGWFVGCLMFQKHAIVYVKDLLSFTCCHTEIEDADQTFFLTQSQYTDTGQMSPSIDPIIARHLAGWPLECQVSSHWYDSTQKIPMVKAGIELQVCCSSGCYVQNRCSKQTEQTGQKWPFPS